MTTKTTHELFDGSDASKGEYPLPNELVELLSNQETMGSEISHITAMYLKDYLDIPSSKRQGRRYC